jgi:hypothetical protein
MSSSETGCKGHLLVSVSFFLVSENGRLLAGEVGVQGLTLLHCIGA